MRPHVNHARLSANKVTALRSMNDRLVAPLDWLTFALQPPPRLERRHEEADPGQALL